MYIIIIVVAVVVVVVVLTSKLNLLLCVSNAQHSKLKYKIGT